MNWGAWLQGLISALATAGLTILATMAALEKPPTGWQLFIIAGIPALVNFFAYIKQSPPPIKGGSARALLPLALASALALSSGCATGRQTWMDMLGEQEKTVMVQVEKIPAICKVALFDSGWVEGTRVLSADDVTLASSKALAELEQYCAPERIDKLTYKEMGKVSAIAFRLWIDRALAAFTKFGGAALMSGLPAF
jgi:hypothetical protein